MRRRAPLPATVGLQLARLVDAAPDGNDWLHEVKFDGYRVLAWRDGDEVRISSRGGQDWTSKLPQTAAAVAQLRCDNCILDGELITMDQAGRSSFGLLQQRFGESGGERRLRVMLFDLLFVDGEDLRPRAQLERKHKLAELLRQAPAPLLLSSYLIGGGVSAVREACAQGLEGIICKRIDAPYEDGRAGAWLKVKCVDSDEFAVVGYTPGKGARERLGSLLLATPTRSGGWRYRGRVGTGMNEQLIDELLQKLRKLHTERAPDLESAPSRAQLRGATALWVKPQLVVEVGFRGYTEDRLLRQAALKGVRPDRSVDSLRPSQVDSARVSRKKSRH